MNWISILVPLGTVFANPVTYRDQLFNVLLLTIEQLSSKTIVDQHLMIVTASVCFQYTLLYVYVHKY